MKNNIQSQNTYEELNTIENERDKARIGLCTTCKNGPTCMFLNGLNRQILHCEEFQIAEEEVEKQVNTLPGNNTQNEVKTAVKGLCASCDNLSFCTFDKPESGIWHCEEYL